MEDLVPFASGAYWLTLVVMLVSRASDLLSTWVATPNLLLEANPFAKKLGWRAGAGVNVVICLLLAFWPLPAIVVATTSLLVAARNFKSAWWMRTLGEERYLSWISDLLHQSGTRFYLACLLGETVLTGVVGVTVAYFGQVTPVLLAVGLGIVAYALAVAFYSLLSIWRLLRA